MVPRYVGVQVFPRAFDAIVIRTVGRQKIQPQPPVLFRLQSEDDLLRAVDRIVVHYHVNHSLGCVVLRQLPQQMQEQQTGPARPLHSGQFTRPRIEGAGQAALQILAGSEDLLLLTGHHHIETDLWIQVNVDFVFVNCDFDVGWRVDRGSTGAAERVAGWRRRIAGSSV